MLFRDTINYLEGERLRQKRLAEEHKDCATTNCGIVASAKKELKKLDRQLKIIRMLDRWIK